MPEILPLFPLNSVVFPGQLVPLHIFEDRYRQLVRDVLASDSEFGISLIRKGKEVGGGAVPVEIGCAVRIIEIEELPDGRFNLSCRGTRRFRITEALDEDPYLRATVEFPPRPKDCEDESTLELAGEVAEHYRRHLALSLALQDGWQRHLHVPGDPVRLADAAAAVLDASPRQKQQVLRATAATTRLQLVQRLLEPALQGLEEQLLLRRRYKIGGLGILN